MTTNCIILMTALPPTTGHRDLIEWAARLPDNEVYVLLSSRSFEPIRGSLRKQAIEDSLSGFPNVTVELHESDEAPQNPEDHSLFWEWWRDTINHHFPKVKGDWSYVAASEDYGSQVAESLGASFMPYDPPRTLNSTKATITRSNPFAHWEKFLPLIQRQYQKRIVVFGQESVGKTTLSKRLSKALPSTWLPEWARPYLETVGPELSPEVMERIYKGQASLQEMTFARAVKPFAVLDTDLYSTIGYYAIGGYPLVKGLEEKASELASDLYLLLPDDGPFVEDQLRYGGDKRESSYNFWKDLLERYHLPYQEVPRGPWKEKRLFMEAASRELFEESWRPVRTFVRD